MSRPVIFSHTMISFARLGLLASLGAVALSGCSTVEEAVRGPSLTPMAYPAQLVPLNQGVVQPAYSQDERAPISAAMRNSAGSLWKAGSRTFFNDQRAAKVGDILTVNIAIDDSANIQNQTQRARNNSYQAGAPALFGLESSIGKVFPNTLTAGNLMNMNGKVTGDGSGSVKRNEKVNLVIAAVVTNVLPNGNLVIQGRQEVKTDRELRELTVSGIVRPEDISAGNTIKHTQIAEARISYGGRGDISRMTNPPAAQSVAERFLPF